MERQEPIAFARKLRREQTRAEALLWAVVRNRRLGYKFRRQSPWGPYTLDFVCIERRLVIEVDGEQHENSASDATRDAWLGAHGFRVLRFWQTEVLGNLEGVCHVIAEALGATPHPACGPPLPTRGEGTTR